MGTKYTYSKGATYQSESTPITISRISAGDYKIKVVKGELEGEYSYTAGPGTQGITITIAEKEPYDLSKAYWTDRSGTYVDGSYARFVLSGVTVNKSSSVSKVILSGTYDGFNTISDFSIEGNVSDPNGEYIIAYDMFNGLDSVLSLTFTAYDSNDNVLQTAEITKQ